MNDGLVVRRARESDLDRIVELVAGDPGQEAVAIAGCVEAARSFGIALAHIPHSPRGWQHSTVAELDGRVVGVAQTLPTDDAYKVTPRLLLLALRVFGVGIVSVLGRYRARLRVDIAAPKDSYHIEELDVDPALRNRGIGGALLDYVEEEARQRAASQMSLNTTVVNPAQHLYERHGFRIVETRTDRTYERYTGIPGRVLMVKELR
ncbi:MAG: GNAT family N-acetyltransferase [Dehalococcoidia bacterium]